MTNGWMDGKNNSCLIFVYNFGGCDWGGLRGECFWMITYNATSNVVIERLTWREDPKSFGLFMELIAATSY